ncbi:MAG: hypothetical protein AB201_00270 [Parcubacteria bacterium C7867-006]|nr:MAG: hypothetical protein AB201_00270 [Parcubacteria bacterium C7867-006]
MARREANFNKTIISATKLFVKLIKRGGLSEDKAPSGFGAGRY